MTGHGVTIPRTKSLERESFQPGPATYHSEHSKDCFKTRSTVVCIPTAGRKDMLGIEHKSSNPGPSDYVTERSSVIGHGVTIPKDKSRDKLQVLSPGPSTYHSERSKDRI